ncbi:MAG: hypothetical protein GZ088_09385 [Acidipila sp.]|nr:hypothetical protein [Acidipila sp.]
MLAILNRENTQTALTENAKALPLPWLMIKDSLFSFVDELRAASLYFVAATDSDTANAVAPLMHQLKSIELSLGGGTLKLLHSPAACGVVREKAKIKFGAKWLFMESHVIGFFEHLNGQNIFLAEATGPATEFLKAKTENVNVRLRGGG